MRGQFTGWSRPDRDAKIERLFQIIQASNLLSFEISLSQKTYNKIVKPHAPRGLGNAHFCCIFGIVSSVSRYLSTQDLGITVDFYFDNQDGVQEDFDLFFEYMKKDIPHSARKLIRKKPEFLDDKIALPLQACDMLAWHIRREHEIGQSKFSLADKLANPHLHISSEISDEILSKWGRAFEQTPNVKLVQSKSQWQKMRKITRDALSAGYIPPYGTHWRNFMYIARQRIRGFLRR